MDLKIAFFVAFLLTFIGICVPRVSSLECYSCFSYQSNVECENENHLKKITCNDDYDTCVKFEIKVLIAEANNGSTNMVLNNGYARYCGKKQDCQSYPPVCPHLFHQNDADVQACNITCCDEDITNSACHDTPHFPGDVVPTYSAPTSNYTVATGVGGHGTQMTASIWFLFVTGALIWMSV